MTYAGRRMISCPHRGFVTRVPVVCATIQRVTMMNRGSGERLGRMQRFLARRRARSRLPPPQPARPRAKTGYRRLSPSVRTPILPA